MADGGDESQRVLPEAQAGLIQVLRPYTNFETDYQGLSGLVPVMFTPGGEAFDKRAGEPGYSPNLVAGLSVAMASRLLIYLPQGNLFQEESGSGVVQLYNWWVIWRIRNARDWRVSRIPFHYPKQGAGLSTIPPDLDPGPRVVLPATWQPVIFNDPDPPITNATTPAFQRIDVEVYQPQNARTGLTRTPIGNPMLPGHAFADGQVEQGVTQTFSDRNMPSFLPVEVTAMGDELLLACTKEQVVSPSGATWAFTVPDPDFAFSVLFGRGGSLIPFNPQPLPLTNLGVFVSTVSAGP